MVVIFKKHDKDAGEVEFVEIWEHWTEAKLYFKGRLILHNFALVRLAKQAKTIRATFPGVCNGSDATKALSNPGWIT